MFRHKHYVPILKGKRAEFPALGSLKAKKKRITPLIEAVGGFPVSEASRPALLHSHGVWKNMAWG
jgi:hypothetical protein